MNDSEPLILNLSQKQAESLPFADLCDQAWSLVDSARTLITQDEADDEDDEDAVPFAQLYFESLPEYWRIVYAVQELNNNLVAGGFGEFFWTHEDNLNEDVARGLERIGAHDHLEIFKEAAALFLNLDADDDEEADEQADDLRELSRSYLAASESDEDPRERLAVFILANLDEFKA
ncbi:MAG: DUF4375 domain-containing protein [Verrucomicrobiales bacterium]|nr:DUF4375 domain-containing protein [Verrucomicrobiales bacterium]MCP5557325.1 DUF4375 domain-containing protein [Verrucomicrobiaceae bacterium]